ncbi:isoprenylcysteine carboxylmethyltransferase family protein [Mycobacterium intracellulare]|uniref:methyltransferase family protein n=1 Tax=Mycobacterium intracellulare TaxID=1767 RepID=UPI001CD9C416|nr:isoprenylcysteine carboxylmethyltransferase family protein [Mycobacterium intracellulare]MCA2306037.1 isoprenylcysteine carboxylmethyltransferase family protein [Mycobacterium intracellulare]MCA2348264.1 isoprenylcysteine carboxylmethyltransferase family protein [Mycobacterium intracellulare]
MPVTALALYLVFAALGFGWRSWAQRRRTGSTGFRGVSGRPGSLHWFAGVGFIVAILAGVAAPLLQLGGILVPIAVVHTPAVQATGLVAAIAGLAGTLYAQHGMGESWRIGVDPGETTALVRTGAFGWVRNPIFAAMLVFAAGIALMTPNPLALAAFVLLLAAIELQVRVVEEPYLAHIHGHAYTSYRDRVGRFVPGIGRSKTPPLKTGGPHDTDR